MPRFRNASLAASFLVLQCVALSAWAGTAREVPVDALWFSLMGETASGGTSRVVVEVDANPRKTIRVGFYEEVAGGSGAMWRASGWMASVLSSLTLGVELSDYRVAFDVGGRIDGPSAGGLLTTALMAAFLGDTVRPDAAMTGIINPDGTIGPVGGIPHKIDGAAQRGKTLVLVPFGQRFDMDLKLKQPVDLIERGKARGVEVREVRDISEAYALLTGKPLPHAKPAQDLPPEVPASALAKLRERTQALMVRYRTFASHVKAAGRLEQELQGTMAQAERAQSLAVQAFTQGLLAVAYDRMITANLTAEAVLLGVTMGRVAREGGEQGVQNLLGTLKNVVGKFDALIKKLDAIRPKTLSDAAALCEAYGMAAQAGGSFLLGQEREREMATLAKRARERGGQTQPSAPPRRPEPDRPRLGVQLADGPNGVTVQGVADGSPAERIGIQVGDIILQFNGMQVPNAAALQQMIGAVRAADPVPLVISRGGQTLGTTVVLGGGESVAAPEAAAPALDGKAAEQAGQKLFEAALFYRMADFLLDLAEDRLAVGMGFGGTPTPSAEAIGKSAKLFQTSADAVMSYLDGVVLQERANQAGASLESFRGDFMTQDPEYALAFAAYMANRILSISDSPYAKLGPAMMLYSGAASLVAKYYSLGAEVGEFGTIKKVRMEKALVNMLDLGFKNARDSINLAKQSGVEPVIAALYYEAASFLREDDLDAKLSALTYLWQATAQARLLAFLAGGLRLERSSASQPGVQIPRPQPPVTVPAPRPPAGR